MRLYVIILTLLVQGCFWVTCGRASEANLEWNEAIGSVKDGVNDFAFMDFRTLLENYPKSRHTLAAEFAEAEYYYLENNLEMANDAFENFYAKYPQHEEALIALAYLYKIAQVQKNTDAMKDYRHKAATFRQLTFIFNDQKSYNFLSGFQRKHKLVYTINKVELYVNDKLFTEVPF